MSKDRQAITCNGRPAFYASMYEDIRQCAMDRGWAVALHGSLASDMDIMAMPWTEQAEPFSFLVYAISKLFSGNDLADNYTITYGEKAHNRVVATIPIWADFHLDISTIDLRKSMSLIERILKKLEDDIEDNPEASLGNYRAGLYKAIDIVKEEGGLNELQEKS